ncbi:MAG: response regulator [Pseudonocardia sp.]
MNHDVRVLVVDDDPLVRGALTMMLDGAEGIRVVGEAGDGDEVSAVVDAHAPDVVLMDLRMPRLNGIAATRRLRTRQRPPEVIVLTTFDSDENVLRARRAGPADSCSRTPRPRRSSRRSGASPPAIPSSPPTSPGG